MLMEKVEESAQRIAIPNPKIEEGKMRAEAKAEGRGFERESKGERNGKEVKPFGRWKRSLQAQKDRARSPSRVLRKGMRSLGTSPHSWKQDGNLICRRSALSSALTTTSSCKASDPENP
jgi:hypothetical protein